MKEIFRRHMHRFRNWLGRELPHYGIFKHRSPQDGTGKASNLDGTPWLQAFDKIPGLNFNPGTRILDEQGKTRPVESHNSPGPDLPHIQSPRSRTPEISNR